MKLHRDLGVTRKTAWFAWLPGFNPFHGSIQAIHHSVGEYVRDRAHTNGMESFWSLLKQGYQGMFQKISSKHLDRYVTEFAGRYNIRLLDPLDRMPSMVVGMVGKRS